MSTATTAGIVSACGSCLACCDGRQGLRVDISGCLPTVGSWTTSEATDNDFEILSISWGVDTSKPIYLGQNVSAGHITGQCCEKIIGSLVATWTPPTEGVELTTFHLIILGTTGTGEVYMRLFWYSTGDDSPYFFRWIVDPSGYPSGYEAPLCTIKRAAWTTLGNAQAADYDAALVYITESDGYELEVIPTYGNDDGGYLHPGTGNDAQNAVDLADLCACNSCFGTFDYELTITGLASICIGGVIQPGAGSETIPFTLPTCGMDPTDNPSLTPATGAGVNCSGNPLDACFFPTNVSTYEVAATVEFLGYAWTGAKMVRAFISVTVDCASGGFPTTVTGQAYFDLTCTGGIVSDSQSVTLSGGVGSITVDIVPA